MKHKQHDVIYVMDVKVNDEIVNASGYFIRYLNSGINKGCCLVQICGTFFTVDEKKVLTPKAFDDEMSLRRKIKKEKEQNETKSD